MQRSTASMSSLDRTLRPIPTFRRAPKSLTQKSAHRAGWLICRLPGSWCGFMVIANSDVDRGAPSDLSARGRELPERSQRCRVGAARTTDPRGIAGRPTTPRTGCPWRYLPRDSFPPRSTVYNIFCKFQREGVWKAIWQSCIWRSASGRDATPALRLRFSTANRSNRPKRGR